MEKYIVTCANPPSELKIEEGDQVQVQGTKFGDKITAKSIQNITKGSPQYHISIGYGLAMPQEVDLTGKASKIEVASGYTQFELEVTSSK